MTAIATPSDQDQYSARNTQLLEIPLEDIEPSALNPRQHFDQEALEELAASIRAHGVIEPLVVRAAGGRYSLIAGERRWRAAQIAGLASVPAVLRDEPDDTTVQTLMLIENLHRADLDPIEEATGYRALQDLGMTQAEIGAAVNRSQPAIANAMRLLELPEDVLTKIQAGQLTPAHGRALVKFADWPKLCTAIAELAINEGFTSKRLEKGFDHSGIDVWPLREKKLLKSIDSYGLPAGVTADTLENAGLTVFRSSYSACTPDVEGFAAAVARIEKEHDAEQQRRMQKLHDQAKAAGTPVIRLEKLAYDDYKDLRHRSRPEGCGPDCACAAQALDTGGEVVEICTDPKRFQKLETAKTRQESKARKTAAKDKAAELDALLAAAPALDQRGLAIVVAHRLWQFPKAVGKRLVQEFAAGMLDPAIFDSYDARRDTYPKLAELPVENLVQILVHGTLLDHISQFQQYGGMPPAALVWYMDGDSEPAPAAASVARATEPIEMDVPAARQILLDFLRSVGELDEGIGASDLMAVALTEDVLAAVKAGDTGAVAGTRRTDREVTEALAILKASIEKEQVA